MTHSHYDCPDCQGHGDKTCSECGSDKDCGNCYGTGLDPELVDVVGWLEAAKKFLHDSPGHATWAWEEDSILLGRQSDEGTLAISDFLLSKHPMLGKTRDELGKTLGEPDATSFVTRKYQKPMIWKYGEIEYHFGNDDKVWLVYTEDQNPRTLGKLDGCWESLTVAKGMWYNQQKLSVSGFSATRQSKGEQNGNGIPVGPTHQGHAGLRADAGAVNLPAWRISRRAPDRPHHSPKDRPITKDMAHTRLDA